jgi:hypothetical protein
MELLEYDPAGLHQQHTSKWLIIECLSNGWKQNLRKITGGLSPEKFGTSSACLYFCTPFGRRSNLPSRVTVKEALGLSYGVTVALQILVLSVKVRILVAQQSRRFISGFVM